ncbi:MAG TPA: hypothetical protein VGP38_11980 [Rubrobacter sp.]|nr:hypothetical protein [Rubrobacter sp.]
MVSLDRRLAKLEEVSRPKEFSDWPIEDQFEVVLEALRVHRAGGTRQRGTDREIHLMGLLCALWALPDGLGEYSFPSGTVVAFSDHRNGTSSVEASGLVGVDDLPEGVREYWERMETSEQPERERRSYEGWPAAKERREYWRHSFSDEQVRARSEESKRRDRELLERNRAACGLPPLTPGQIEEWGLAETLWERAASA